MEKMNYDSEEDILSLSRERKVKASIDIGDFIIDIDHNDNISGIEILNASQNLGLTREQLNSLENASMQITYKPDSVYVFLLMKFEDKEKDIGIPLIVNLGRKTVTTENANFAIA